jgi:hypothetical protein
MSQLADLNSISFSHAFLIKSLLWFALLNELLSIIEPTRICVPIKRVMQFCNFQVTICPCGFYSLAEHALMDHLKHKHPIVKEIHKYLQNSESIKIVKEKVSRLRDEKSLGTIE